MDESISEVLLALQFCDDIIDVEMNFPNNMEFGEKVRTMVNEYKKQLSDE
jgi:hypothetical protein